MCISRFQVVIFLDLKCRNGLIFSFCDAAVVVFFFDHDRPIIDRELQGPTSFLTLVPKFNNDGQSFTTTSGFDGEEKDKAFTCT